MMDLTHSGDVERFRAVVSRRLGLQFDDSKIGFLGEVLLRRLERLKRSSAAYLQALDERPPTAELSALAQELTVTETYFFRNNDQFRVLAEIVLPERIGLHAGDKTLRFLSAGCASGEEAYSIAIVARETISDPSWKVSIRAVDLNPGALERARLGRFSAWALRETPPDVQRKWFHPDGRDMILDSAVRAEVQFEARNLAADDLELWSIGTYDAIYCRNVVMYFTPEQGRALMARLARALAPGGYLFLGHAETLRGLSDEFHLRHTHGTFYYQRKESLSDDMLRSVPIARKSIPLAAVSPTTIYGDAWVGTIREASERVATLIAAHDAKNKPEKSPDSTWSQAWAMELLQKEHFTEALAYIRELPPQSGPNPDILLLEATLLAQSHKIAEARDACERLLLIDELNAGAHYVLALCWENSAEWDIAIDHDRVAVYLDPAFAMPRLHLGLLARRIGDRDTARRELGQALVLLKREDASRLLLFGGGFNREALVALCGTALRDCGGQP